MDTQHQHTCLMNPATGLVDTRAGWMNEKIHWTTNANGQTPAQQFAALVPVVQNASGDWVELSRSNVGALHYGENPMDLPDAVETPTA